METASTNVHKYKVIYTNSTKLIRYLECMFSLVLKSIERLDKYHLQKQISKTDL